MNRIKEEDLKKTVVIEEDPQKKECTFYDKDRNEIKVVTTNEAFMTLHGINNSSKKFYEEEILENLKGFKNHMYLLKDYSREDFLDREKFKEGVFQIVWDEFRKMSVFKFLKCRNWKGKIGLEFDNEDLYNIINTG